MWDKNLANYRVFHKIFILILHYDQKRIKAFSPTEVGDYLPRSLCFFFGVLAAEILVPS